MGSYKVVCIVGVVCRLLAVGAMPPSVVNTAGHLISPESELEIATWIDVLYGIRFDEDERRCAEQQKVLHRESNECFQLYHRGPCGRREWVVFDRRHAAAAAAGKLVAVCKRRECAPKWGYDTRTGKCFEHGDCPPHTAFHYTLFGDGKCLCNATAAAFGERQRCQELFRDDVCPRGKILAPRYTLLGGLDSVCTPDPCLEGSTSPPPKGPEVSTSGYDTVLPGDRSSSLYQAQTTYTPRQSGMRPNPWEIPTRRPGFPGDVIHFGGSRRMRGRDVVDAGVRVFSRPNSPPSDFGSSSRGALASGSHQHLTPLPVASILQNQRRQAEDRAREEGYIRGLTSRLQRATSTQHARGVSATRVLNVLAPTSNPDPPASDRALRGVNFSVPHGAANALSLSVPSSGANRLNVLLPQTRTLPAATSRTETEKNSSVADDATATGGKTDVRLNVKYQDGTSTCHTGAELNITCELQMKPLFSELSDVKVPLCVEKLFRFAIGRVGKSEECVRKDDGVCATKVNVVSSQPFDWDFE